MERLFGPLFEQKCGSRKESVLKAIVNEFFASYCCGMSASDDTSPATKQDIGLLMEEMGRMDQRIHNVEVKMGTIEVKMDTLKDEIIHEFRVIDEKRQSQFEFFAESLLDHNGRIKVVERRLQLRP